MVKVKICGLSRPCDIEAVNVEKPDYIGFVFAESRRKVVPEQALELRRMLRADIIPVGVFVDERIDNILSLIRKGIIDIVQLHGTENEAYIQKIKTMTDKKIIKAISVQNRGDAQKWSNTAADYLLLDNKSGGTGESFDWGLIGKIETPYFLAGGLSIENIGEALTQTAPFAVDISSGVETDGLKDPLKIKEFIRRVREWER